MKKVLSLFAVVGLGLSFTGKVFAGGTFQVCSFNPEYTLTNVVATHFNDNGTQDNTEGITLNANTHCSKYFNYSWSEHDSWGLSADNVTSSNPAHTIDSGQGPWSVNGQEGIVGWDLSSTRQVQFFIKNPDYSSHSVSFDVVMYVDGDYQRTGDLFNLQPNKVSDRTH